MTHRFLLVLLTLLVTPALRAGDAKDIVIPADKLAAADQYADQPTQGKWWLKRDAQDWEVHRRGADQLHRRCKLVQR